jgi:hypothetical protein
MSASQIPTFPAHILTYGPWSISKVGSIEKCSLQFDYKYGPQKQKELETYFESRIGVAVHHALELALGGTAIRTAFQHSADKHELTSNEIEELEAFYEQIQRFAAKMSAFQQKHGVHPAHVMIEKKLGMRSDFTSCSFFEKGVPDVCGVCRKSRENHDSAGKCQYGDTVFKETLPVFFRGVVDFAMLTKNKDLIIIDHKSGKEKDISQYEAQFKSYCLMAHATIPDLRGVQTAINFVMTDKMIWNPYVKADVIRNEYRPWLVEYLTRSCEKLLRPPSPSQGWWCNWCGYKSICPVNEKNRGNQESVQ